LTKVVPSLSPARPMDRPDDGSGVRARRANIAAFDVAKQIEYPAYQFGTSGELLSLKREVEALGPKALTHAGDVRSDDDITRRVEDTLDGLRADRCAVQ